MVVQSEGEVDVVVLIKAAPEIGKKHGETVCVAGIDRYGKWHRLYPVPFRDLTQEQRFKRWDIVRVRWRRPPDDDRVESKRIEPTGLKIVGQVHERERPALVSRALVESIEQEAAAGRSLALIRPSRPTFQIRRLNEVEMMKSSRRRNELLSQTDLLSANIISREPCPYVFKYRFWHGGRERTHVCIDWETEQTFFKWRRLYGEETALAHMRTTWGEEIPRRGLVFAMGTHRVKIYRNWLLSGVIQAPEVTQSDLLA